MIRRNITSRVLDALSDTPVVLLNGARQTGKSTLVQTIAEHSFPARYVTLDDATVLVRRPCAACSTTTTAMRDASGT